MTFPPGCQWNEMQQLGTDYEDVAEVERYDRRMGQFRDLPAEDAAILASLALPPGARVLELGSGTAHFALAAARAGHRVTAVDVSAVMLDYSRRLADAEGLAIDFVHAGFLTFRPEPGAYDAAVSVAALHHLPDLWKAVALDNVRSALRRGGRFLLRDIVFAADSATELPGAIEQFMAAVPETMHVEAARHAAQEHSTMGWIHEGLLARAGFAIRRYTPHPSALVEYLCEAV